MLDHCKHTRSELSETGAVLLLELSQAETQVGELRPSLREAPSFISLIACSKAGDPVNPAMPKLQTRSLTLLAKHPQP